MSINSGDFKYLSFDCYGTLVDWEQGILSSLESVFGNYEAVSKVAMLQSFAKWEAHFEAGAFLNYREVLTRVQAEMCREFSVSCDNPTVLPDSVSTWKPFADSTLALRHLKQHFKLAILSNVDREMFAGTCRLLDFEFDLVCTAEEIGAYKPSLDNFHFLLDRLDCDRSQLLHVAQSVFHDHVPAAKLGIQSVWVNRPSLIPGQGVTKSVDMQPSHQVTSMAELVQLLMPLG